MMWFRKKCRVVHKPRTWEHLHFCKKPSDRRLWAGTIVECPECGNLWILDVIPDVLGLNKVWKRYYGE